MATKIISGASKTGQRLLASAERNQGTELRDVYGKWSNKKETAMHNCKREYLEDNGYNFRITGHNCDRFTVAWNYNSLETGEVMTKIKTGENTYIIDGSRPVSMITIEELSRRVEREFANFPSILEEWKDAKPCLGKHLESIPKVWYEGPDGDHVEEWEEIEVNGDFMTYDDDLAYFCWSCGCNMGWTQDYWDGSYTYFVSLPETEKEFLKNLADAKKYAQEVLGDAE